MMSRQRFLFGVPRPVANKRLGIGVLVLLLTCMDVQGGFAQSEPLDRLPITSKYIHGTIDVIVETHEGFVLATDSRGTADDGSFSDDVQKLFPVGKNAAAVIAGLVGAEVGMEGFRLRDAIGSQLQLLGRLREAKTVTAVDIAAPFNFGFASVAGLLAPGTSSGPMFVGEVSAVSLASDGVPDWVTFYLVAEPRHEEGISYISTRTLQYFSHSNAALGLRFDVQLLGVPSIAESLLHAASPLRSDPYSQRPILKKYYRRKQLGELDKFTLSEGIELARALVQITIKKAQRSDGVGGPIDIATLTKNGLHWVEKKNFVPLPAPPGPRFFGSTLRDQKQRLDGIECVGCRFVNVDLTYEGTADTELIGCTFEDRCTLTISAGAKQKQSVVVERLRKVLSPHCNIVEK